MVAVAAKPTVPVVATETKASNENKLTVATGEDKVVKVRKRMRGDIIAWR